jgi:hypothetical protein
MLTPRRCSHNQAEAENLRKIELALEKVLRALAKFQAYVLSGANKPKQRIRLAQAMHLAIEEFIAKFPLPSPRK